MWNFGDLALDIIERNRALGLDEYGRTTFDSFDEEEIPPIVEQPIFPLMTICEDDVKIKCTNSYNITLTDEQFEKFLDVIKSFKR